MSPWSRCRAETEPLVAIVAVFAVAVGLTTYAGVLDATLPTATERDVAGPTLQRAYAALAPAGVVEPDRLTPDAVDGPEGYRIRIALATREAEWQVGPDAPAGADAASRPVTVRVAPGVNRPGRLSVAVWR